MPNLSIKDVPEAWAQALRERAASNHRSLQGELMALIQGAVAPPSGESSGSNAVADSLFKTSAVNAPSEAGRRGKVVGFDRFGHPIVRQGWKTVEQIAAEIREKSSDTKLCHSLPKGVDIIREERDAR